MHQVTEQNITGRVAEPGVDPRPQTALDELVPKVESLLSELAVGRRLWLTYVLGRIATEATDASANTHWWEVGLHLLTRAAENQGETGRPVVEAVQRVLPSLRQRLGWPEGVTLREITAETVAASACSVTR